MRGERVLWPLKVFVFFLVFLLCHSNLKLLYDICDRIEEAQAESPNG